MNDNLEMMKSNHMILGSRLADLSSSSIFQSNQNISSIQANDDIRQRLTDLKGEIKMLEKSDTEPDYRSKSPYRREPLIKAGHSKSHYPVNRIQTLQRDEFSEHSLMSTNRHNKSDLEVSNQKSFMNDDLSFTKLPPHQRDISFKRDTQVLPLGKRGVSSNRDERYYELESRNDMELLRILNQELSPLKGGGSTASGRVSKVFDGINSMSPIRLEKREEEVQERKSLMLEPSKELQESLRKRGFVI